MEQELTETGKKQAEMPALLEERVRQLEALLQDKSRQLEEVTQELDDITFAVSHDLKAPIRAISGFADILKEEQYNNLDAEGKRVAGIIETNAKRLTDMINELITHSAISKKIISHRQVNMRQLAEENLANLISAKEKELFTITIADLPGCIADEKMIRQVWLNLLNIALLYASKNGHFTIMVDFEDEGTMNTYFIKCIKTDLSQSGLQNFEALQQASGHQRLEGAGTGSAFIKRVIFKHAGNFWVQTVPGKECTFFFSLPKK